MTTLEYTGPHANMVSGWNDGDDYGTCMNLAFAVCDVLHFHRNTWIPDEWDYSPGIGPEALEEFFDSDGCGRLTDDELRTFGTALLEWRDALIAAGKGY